MTNFFYQSMLHCLRGFSDYARTTSDFKDEMKEWVEFRGVTSRPEATNQSIKRCQWEQGQKFVYIKGHTFCLVKPRTKYQCSAFKCAPFTTCCTYCMHHPANNRDLTSLHSQHHWPGADTGQAHLEGGRLGASLYVFDRRRGEIHWIH